MKKVLLLSILFVLFAGFVKTPVFAAYIVTAVSTASTDCRWPSINNNGDIVWAQKIGSYWQIIKNGSQITFDNYDKGYPSISDSGDIVYVKYGVGSGVGRAIIKHPNTTIEFSSRDLYSGAHRDAGEHPDISSDGEIIWYYDFCSYGCDRRLNSSVRGRISDYFGRYDYPSILSSTGEYVYAGGLPGLGIYSSLGLTIGRGEIPRISKYGIVYIYNGIVNYSKDGHIFQAEDETGKYIEASYADIEDNGTIVFERAVGGTYAIFQATPLVDTDGDGLLDDWEINGVDVDKDGTPDLDLPAMGADPLHKDIFVEIDYMVLGGSHTHKPRAGALRTVIDAFKNAPVTNPDGTTGINIHIDAGPTTIMNPVTNETWGSKSQSNALTHTNNLGTGRDPYNWSAFDVIKGGNFSIQRANVFHYSIWGHYLSPELGSVSGISRGFPASDFIVTLGGFYDHRGTTAQQAGTLMHELGHNLSFTHGGNDHIHNKPNYLSIMNYAFQMRGLRVLGKDGYYDYSRFKLPLLNEADLNETIGLSGVAGTYNYGTRFYDNLGKDRVANNINGPIDWNWDGDGGADTNVSVDVNNEGGIETNLDNQDNWANIVFTGGSVGYGEKIDLPLEVEDPEAALVDITEEEDAKIPTDIAVGVSGPLEAFLAPAQSRIYSYKVTNTGNNQEVFKIKVVDTQGWASLSNLPEEVNLDPGGSTIIIIEVSVPAGTPFGASDLLTVTAYSSTNPAMMDEVETTTFITKSGDINLDGNVDCLDIAIIKASFGKKAGQTGFDQRADVNADEVINIRDLSFVSNKLPAGTRCP